MGKKILIVDDSDKSRMVFRLLLREAGYATAEAADGETALRLARERPPRPGIHGYSNARGGRDIGSADVKDRTDDEKHPCRRRHVLRISWQ